MSDKAAGDGEANTPHGILQLIAVIKRMYILIGDSFVQQSGGEAMDGG